MNVYVDTSAFLAVIDADDAQHRQAALIWKALIENDETLVCSNYILVETLALIQHRLGMNAVKQFQEDVYPLLHIAWIGEPDHRAGVAAVLAASRRRLSLVDCVSFEVMRRHGIRCVFCFDTHFKEQGFEPVV